MVYSQSRTITEDLTLRFFIVEKDGSISVATDYPSYQTLGIFITSQELYDGIYLCNEDPFNIWINGRMYHHDVECEEYSKATFFSNTENDTLFITLNTKGDFGDIVAYTYNNNIQASVSTSPVVPKSKNNYRSFVIVASVTIIFLWGILRLYFSTLFNSLFKINLFRRVRRSESSGAFDYSMAILVLLLSLMGSFSYWLIDIRTNQTEGYFLIDHLSIWIRNAMVVFVLIVLKYLVIRLVSNLNSLQGIAFTQISDFIKFFSIASLLVVIVLSGQFWFNYYEMSLPGVFWIYYFEIVYILFILYLFYKIGLSVRYRNLHIISYLCTTEITGALIVALVFIK
jgi:hypothetical protein